jgi:hypothetical protein
MKTWLYGPLGAEHVGGSLTDVFANPVCELLLFPEQPFSTTTIATTPTNDASKKARDIFTSSRFS